MHATAQPVMVNANAKKGMYWAISSQATWEQAEGSTTRARSPDRTVKPHERGTCEDCRFVVISPLGLLKNECVHHKNSDKLDNRLDNLELTTKAAHTGLHARNGECGWAVYHSKKI